MLAEDVRLWDAPAEAPSAASGYRVGTAHESCGACLHRDGRICLLWVAKVRTMAVCDSFLEEPDEPEIEDDEFELAVPEATDLDLGIGSAVKNASSKMAARWPKGTLLKDKNGKSLAGTFMRVGDIMRGLKERGAVDLTGIADTTTHEDGSKLSHVESVSLHSSPNPDVAMLRVRMRVGGMNGGIDKFANLGFYVSRKVFGIEMVQNVLRQLDYGDAIKSVSYTGLKRFAKKGTYNPYKVISRLIRAQGRGVAPILSEQEDRMQYGELFCSVGDVSEADGLIWKCALPVGELKVSPGFDGKPVYRPLRVIEGESADPSHAIGLADIVRAFQEGAVPHVTVPLSHADRVDENTGFVEAIKIAPLEDGRPALWAGVRFTDKNVECKVREGSIANVSVGLKFDYIKKDSGDRYPVALQHLALTNKPWVPSMPPFQAGLSDDDKEAIVVPMEVTNDGPATVVTHPAVERGVWKRRDALCDAIESASDDWELLDFDGSTAWVKDHATGQEIEIEYAFEDGIAVLKGVEKSVESSTSPTDTAAETDPSDVAEHQEAVAPAATGHVSEVEPDSAAEVLAASEQRVSDTDDASKGGDMDKDKTAEVELSEDIKAKLARLEELEKRDRQHSVDARIEELKSLGLSEHPGLLKTVRNLLLADQGTAVAVHLSEDGGTQETLTVSDIVNAIVDALPKTEEGRYQLSEQHIDVGAPAPKHTANDDAETPAAKAARIREFLAI